MKPFVQNSGRFFSVQTSARFLSASTCGRFLARTCGRFLSVWTNGRFLSVQNSGKFLSASTSGRFLARTSGRFLSAPTSGRWVFCQPSPHYHTSAHPLYIRNNRVHSGRLVKLQSTYVHVHVTCNQGLVIPGSHYRATHCTVTINIYICSS